jgi:hypothetical protein
MVVRSPSSRSAPAVMGPPGAPSGPGVDLYWIPLGAGGRGFVRFNGHVYEILKAGIERRPRLDLYHTALEVHIPEGSFVIEMTPIPDRQAGSRGVAMEGPVGSRLLAPLRLFRYEIRRWRDGVIPDVAEAVAGPQRLIVEVDRARHLLDLVADLPALVWGRDESHAGEMWNSNSITSWLLARSGLPMDGIRPPAGGRAPGWQAGIAVARQQASNSRMGVVAPRLREPAPREGTTWTSSRTS